MRNLLLALAASAALAAEGLAAPLRVVSYNIRLGVGGDFSGPPIAPEGGAGHGYLDRIAAKLAAVAPDVVGFQEIRGPRAESSDIDQSEYLAGKLGYTATKPQQRGPRNSILTRWPILETEQLQLNERTETAQARGLTLARIAVPDHPEGVWFACTHLDHKSKEVRLAQLAVVGKALAARPGPVVLLGDFNSTPDSDEVAGVLTGRYGIRLKDASRPPGRDAHLTFPSWDPNRKIDYVFVGKGVRVARTRVLQGDPRASDHLPLLADLVLPGDGAEAAAVAPDPGPAPGAGLDPGSGLLGTSD